MITVKEAIEILTHCDILVHKHNDNWESNTQNIPLSCLVKDLLSHLSTENDLLRTTLSELRQHTTGTRALQFALARNKELEAEVELWNRGQYKQPEGLKSLEEE